MSDAVVIIRSAPGRKQMQTQLCERVPCGSSSRQPVVRIRLSSSWPHTHTHTLAHKHWHTHTHTHTPTRTLQSECQASHFFRSAGRNACVQFGCAGQNMRRTTDAPPPPSSVCVCAGARVWCGVMRCGASARSVRHAVNSCGNVRRVFCTFAGMLCACVSVCLYACVCVYVCVCLCVGQPKN